MTRRSTSLLVLAAGFLLVLWLAADVLLAVFAGILVAVFLRGSGDWIAARLHVKKSVGLAIFSVLLVVAIAGFVAIAGAALADQVQQLIDSLPSAISSAKNYLDDHSWVQRGVDAFNPSSLAPSTEGTASIFSSSLGALGNAVVIAFVGLYGAIAPSTYVNGFVALFAPSLRATAKDILLQSGVALRGWLRAQFVSMAVVGVLTGLGLWLLGMPLAAILGVLAAALTFIPNIGPVLAAVPAVLIGLSEGVSTALWVVGLYLAVQTIESYLITPRVQQESVSLPPALTISAQLLFGVLFGILGLALATPLAAVALRIGQMFYVERYLDEEKEPGGAATSGR
ncbi:AI-2E family transporter [Tianweitania sp. BSSL-BM11]|uniref:AI-2E family transporter n=1 Tax=Tianweitania aestuarii TaxID=2814886 RepID=A0ABS5RU52_9HYPH|nr:AI-2E family transporter [Tianweitania aestuarii]MBS9720514.1 AI-2E family transporter [Tianweitania aestuarii]